MVKIKSSKKNIYKHEIDLIDLKIKNAPKEKFKKRLEKIKYRGYVVEELEDGRRIIITKPGGKFSFGIIKREDFMVWVYNPKEKTLWLISHRNIWEDLEEKGRIDPRGTIKLIDALKEVFDGKDPEIVLKRLNLNFSTGEPPELLLKAYKWIWGQEDVYYPSGKGRLMSWEEIEKLKRNLENK